MGRGLIRKDSVMYKIEFHYGYERSHETYETYHAFEATDIEDTVDSEKMAAKLANALDCTPDDDDFNCNSCISRCRKRRLSASSRRGGRR